ncbi:hypothetical protein SLS60_002247 [Paraconiothyrium brasiliense]|uniref:RRM domain-containing protein n=1 Tax=Paraconiothyrium brasiliense TaxID=300254 RepID=A0ABR3S1L7_9PLEO
MPRGEKVELGDISAPEDRVLRVTNFHWDATDADVNDFFDGYGLVDWKRSKNAKSGKSTVAYVMLSTLKNVVHAIQELHMKELLGRQVRIMRAKGGFQLTASGLLKLTDSEHGATFAEVIESSTSVKEGQYMSFPPLSISQATSTSGASRRNLRRPGIEMLRARHDRRQPGFDGTEHRVLLISKLHPDANRTAVELFFQGFRIVDYKRKYNDRLGKYNTTAFVLFESVQERDRAKAMKNGQKIFGREVSLEVAIKGVGVSNDGFLPDDAIDIASPPRSQLPPGAGLFRNAGPTTQDTSAPADPRLATYHTMVSDRIGGLGISFDNGASDDDHPQRWAHSDHSVYSQECYPRQESFITKSRVDPYVAGLQYSHDNAAFFRASFSDTTLPTENQVSPRRALRPWNLAGNDSEDKEHNIITEEEWYGFSRD